MSATTSRITSAGAESTVPAHRLSIARLSISAAILMAVSFLLCWIAAAILPVARATHMYIQLFTAADVRSGTALAEGLCWSLVIGLIGGAIFALAYNMTAGFDRRSGGR